MPRAKKVVAVKVSKKTDVVFNRKLAVTLGRIAKATAKLEKLVALAVQQSK